MTALTIGLSICKFCQKPIQYGDIWVRGLQDGKYYHAHCLGQQMSGRWRKVDQFLAKDQVMLLNSYAARNFEQVGSGVPIQFSYAEPLISFLQALVLHGGIAEKNAAGALLTLLRENKTIEVWL